MSDEALPGDVEYLKGLTDIVKNKTLFFIPFFGAYLAFVLGKSDYIKGANPVIWLLIGSIFLVSVRYISLVSDLLWAIETSRMIGVFRRMSVDLWKDKEKDIAAYADVVALIPRMYGAEDWWFKKVMLLMYLGAFVVLQDIFLGDYNKVLASKLTAATLKAFGLNY